MYGVLINYWSYFDVMMGGVEVVGNYFVEFEDKVNFVGKLKRIKGKLSL